MPVNNERSGGADGDETPLFDWEREWHLGGVFDLMPDAIVAVTKDGSIANVNRHLAAMFGYSRGELIGLPVEILLPERVRQRHVGHRVSFQADPRPDDEQ